MEIDGSPENLLREAEGYAEAVKGMKGSVEIRELLTQLQEKYDEYTDNIGSITTLASERRRGALQKKAFRDKMEIEMLHNKIKSGRDEFLLKKAAQDAHAVKYADKWDVPNAPPTGVALEMYNSGSGSDEDYNTSDMTGHSSAYNESFVSVPPSEVEHLLDDALDFLDTPFVTERDGSVRIMNRREFRAWNEARKRGSKFPPSRTSIGQARPHRDAKADANASGWQGSASEHEEDSSSDASDDEDDDDDDEESTKEVKNARNLDLYDMLLGSGLSIEDEKARYTWLIDNFEKQKAALRDIFRSIAPKEFDDEYDKRAFVDILKNLVEEGREKSRQFNNHGKISKAFLQEKRAKATKIRFNTKEEMCIFLLLMYADTIHDANRLQDVVFRDIFIEIVQNNARQLARNMFPHPEAIPPLIEQLLRIIETNPSTYDDDILNLFIRLDKNPEMKPLASLKSSGLGRYYYDNASNASYVTSENRVCTLQTFKDGGSKNDGRLWLFNPHNLDIYWEGDDGTYFGVQFIQKVVESEEDMTEFFALDMITSVNYRIGSGKIVYHRSFERLPICSRNGDIGGIFMDIQLNKQARASWKMLVDIAKDKTNGFSILAATIFKFLGDFGMIVDEVFGITRVNGGRLPYMLAKTPDNFKKQKQISKEEKYRRDSQKRYNSLVADFNKKSMQELRDALSAPNAELGLIRDIESRIVGIGNDRSAQVISKQLAKYTLSSGVSSGFLNPAFECILVCSGEILTKVEDIGGGRWDIVSYGEKPVKISSQKSSPNVAAFGNGQLDSGYASESSAAFSFSSCATGAQEKSKLSTYFTINFRNKEPLKASSSGFGVPSSGFGVPGYKAAPVKRGSVATFEAQQQPQKSVGSKRTQEQVYEDAYFGSSEGDDNDDEEEVDNPPVAEQKVLRTLSKKEEEAQGLLQKYKNPFESLIMDDVSELSGSQTEGGKKRKTRRIKRSRKYKKTRNTKKTKRNKTIKKQRQNKKRKTIQKRKK